MAAAKKTERQPAKKRPPRPTLKVTLPIRGVLMPSRPVVEKVNKDIQAKQAGLILAINEAVRLEEMRLGRTFTQEDAAKLFGVNRTSYSGIVGCRVYLPNCERSAIEGFAKGLKIPVLQVYLLCGFFKDTDCVYVASLEDDLNSIFRSIISRSKDFIFETPSPAIWASWPVTAKYHFVLMYETAAQKTLLKKASIQPPKSVSGLKVVPKY